LDKLNLRKLYGPLCLDYLFGGRTNFNFYTDEAFKNIKKVGANPKNPDILNPDELNLVLIYSLQENNYHVIETYLRNEIQSDTP